MTNDTKSQEPANKTRCALSPSVVGPNKERVLRACAVSSDTAVCDPYLCQGSQARERLMCPVRVVIAGSDQAQLLSRNTDSLVTQPPTHAELWAQP